MSSVNCTGEEARLDSCAFSAVSPGTKSRNDAGVICQAPETPPANCTTGGVRLVGGETELEGRVEVCVNNAWGTVCDSTFSMDESAIICNQTGLPHTGSYCVAAHVDQLFQPILSQEAKRSEELTSGKEQVLSSWSPSAVWALRGTC